MKKQIHLFYISIITMLVYSCGEPNYQPERHSNVPPSSIWVGGPDGGAWIKIENKNEVFDNTFIAVIYNDYTGDIIDSGLFVLNDCKMSDLNLEKIKERLSFHSAEEIYIKFDSIYCIMSLAPHSDSF